MKKLIFNSIFLVTIFCQTSCSDKEEEIPQMTSFYLECSAYPWDYGNVLLNDEELVCFNNVYPLQVSSQGSGNCGEGYENIENPYMSMDIVLSEFDENEPEFSKAKRFINISIPFACNDYSTEKKFFDLISVGRYSFSKTNEDFGKFIVEYNKEGEIYSSLNTDNSNFVVEILEITRNKSSETNAPASVDVKLGLSCLLRSNTGEEIEISRAEVSSRFYRPSPWGVEWDQ